MKHGDWSVNSFVTLVTSKLGQSCRDASQAYDNLKLLLILSRCRFFIFWVQDSSPVHLGPAARQSC